MLIYEPLKAIILLWCFNVRGLYTKNKGCIQHKRHAYLGQFDHTPFTPPIKWVCLRLSKVLTFAPGCRLALNSRTTLTTLLRDAQTRSQERETWDEEPGTRLSCALLTTLVDFQALSTTLLCSRQLLWAFGDPRAKVVRSFLSFALISLRLEGNSGPTFPSALDDCRWFGPVSYHLITP